MLEITLNFKSCPIRILNLNGSPWFVARDVCDALNLPDCGTEIGRLEPDEVYDVLLADLNGGTRNVPALTPGGLFALIGRHHSSEAKAFKRWIDNEAFPSFFPHGIITSKLAGEVLEIIKKNISSQVSEDWYRQKEKEFSARLEEMAKCPPPVPRKADTSYVQAELPFL